MMSMTLPFYLYGERAGEIALEHDPWRTTPLVRADALARRLSTTWDREPPAYAIRNWLDGLLPENGHREDYRRRALVLLRTTGRPDEEPHAGLMLAASRGVEYPGAVSFTLPDGRAHEYVTLTEDEVTTRLAVTAVTAVTAVGQRKGIPDDRRGRGASLTGVRGKISLRLTRDGRWQTPETTGLTTHVIKVEDHQALPGEAGIESIAQRTLRHLGLRAARTRSRLFGSIQTMMSERADRRIDANGEEVVAIHQEDFLQATGAHVDAKFDGLGGEPDWGVLGHMLRKYAADPRYELALLTATLAACALLAHNDLHRRNIGLRHGPVDEPFRVEIAPMYDVSSNDGRVGYTDDLAVAIGARRRVERLDGHAWAEFARLSGEEPERVHAHVQDVVERLPDAVAGAIREARHEDENRLQGAVDDRAAQMLANTRTRCQRMGKVLASAKPVHSAVSK